VRVVPCLLVIAWLSLGTTGCSLFQKKPKDGDASSKSGSKEPARFPTANTANTAGGDPIRGSSFTAPAGDTTLLAGTVLDDYNNRVKQAYVSWVELETKKEEHPIDVEVGPDGYFTIRGLKANQHYKLTARAKDGSRVLAGITYVKAPDIHVVIRLRANMANAGTPPIPGAPAYTPKSEEEPKKTSARPTEPHGVVHNPGWTAGTTNPASGGGARPAFVPDLPSPVSIPTPPPNNKPAPVTPSGGWEPGIASDAGAPKALMQVPNQSAPPVRMDSPVGLVAPPMNTPALVPSCVLVGKQLINFALYDLKQQPWEYRTQHRGKLVLIDFWGSWCVPCKQTIPELVTLQNKYGPSGLEIIGVAYEHAGTFEEQARRVSITCQALQVNYRMLMGAGKGCPLQTSFMVESLPTLILIDENGMIRKRYVGRPDQSKLEDLEFEISRRLGVRR
jgi:thiol-disulfide isomerase/thioredoxin